MAKLVLASASPRRQELLGRMGIQYFDVRVPDTEENFPQVLKIRILHKKRLQIKL